MNDDGQRDGWFVRAAGAVGDLGNPFYREERRRDVWNEASAVGFQLMLWLGLACTAGLLWIGGGPALPYAMVLLGVVGVPAVVSLTYAEKLGVRVEDATSVGWRVVPGLLLFLAVCGGILRSVPDTSIGQGMWWGTLVGGGIVLVGLAWTAFRKQHVDQPI